MAVDMTFMWITQKTGLPTITWTMLRIAHITHSPHC